KNVVYIGAQYLFRSRDHGQSWDRISPDLTTNDPQKQKQEESGGVTVDNSFAEMHTTIYSISESPRNKDLIWVGTDDGNVQVTRDGGKTWTNVVGNIPGLPKASWVNWVEAGRFDEGTAYAAFDRHTFGDMDPYVFKTTDYGQTWTPLITKAQGVRGYAHVIKEDTVSPNLLFAGTEFGLWISLDGGKQWAQYKGGDFPNVAVRDLVVHPRESDLVIATHGRGIWIVDDITPLRKLTPQVMAQDAVFLTGKPTQQRIEASGGWAEGAAVYVGPDPPDAALITYYQKKRHIFGRMKIQVFDSNGKLVDTLPANSRRGISRVEWPMNLKAPKVPPAATVAFEANQGPRVVPGTYTIKMVRGDQTYTTPLTVLVDPRAKYGQAERQENFDTSMKVYNLLNDMSYGVAEINGVRNQLSDRAAKVTGDDALREQLQSLADKSDDIRKKIVATKEGGAITGEERIREKTTQLYGNITNYEGRPADYQVARIGSLTHELNDVMEEFSKSITSQLAEVNQALAAKNLEAITPQTREQWNKESGDDDDAGAAKSGGDRRELGERE
ncbi:MAG TPA: glycosyl hydrolase, partial [Terriglobales bacterium]|nr:glycosyl hydrolase [Terriglobales bacterium]